MSKFNPDFSAIVLVAAVYKGDKAAAQEYGVTPRSIYNWRKRLDEEKEFSEIFRLKSEAMEKEWASDVGVAIRASIDFLKRAAQSGNAKDPEMIRSVAGGLKIMAEVAAMKEVLDARFSGEDREVPAEN